MSYWAQAALTAAPAAPHTQQAAPCSAAQLALALELLMQQQAAQVGTQGSGRLHLPVQGPHAVGLTL